MLPPEHPKFIAAQAGTWHMSEDQARVFRQQTEGGARHCVFRKDEVIYRQGERSPYFYFVLKGQVQLSSVYPDGSVFVFDVMGRNGLFGDATVLAGRPYIAAAIAITGCELLRFDAREVLAALPGNPEFAATFVRVMADREFGLALRLRHMSHLDPDICVGGLLHSLTLHQRQAVEAAAAPSRAPAYIVNLTQEQIANMTGLSRITVSRSLKRLQDGGLIICVKRQISVPDPARLLAMLSGEPTAIPLSIRVRQSDLPAEARPPAHSSAHSPSMLLRPQRERRLDFASSSRRADLRLADGLAK